MQRIADLGFPATTHYFSGRLETADTKASAECLQWTKGIDRSRDSSYPMARMIQLPIHTLFQSHTELIQFLHSSLQGFFGTNDDRTLFDRL